MMNKKILLVALPALFMLFISWYERLPKGIRNNNPLNIRNSDAYDWDGEIGSDFEDFVIFDTPENGIRAAARLLKTYREKYGLTTIAGIVSKWAPDNENDTASYIKSVSLKTNISANADLNDADYVDIVAAMIYHENGQNPYAAETIKTHVERGLA